MFVILQLVQKEVFLSEHKLTDVLSVAFVVLLLIGTVCAGIIE